MKEGKNETYDYCFFRIRSCCFVADSWKAMTDKSVTSNDSHKFSLKPPPFTQSAFAQETPEDVQEIGDRLDNEAGIAAYYQAPGTIDLSLVRGQFRTIETETSDYIIGSIAVLATLNNLTYMRMFKEWLDIGIHANNEPPGKIINPTGKTINTTNFTTVISILTDRPGNHLLGRPITIFGIQMQQIFLCRRK
ncbi:MAG: hypothetical protein IPK53_09130 [bacterium]|nr:hypothetical protein [bacterium]